MQYKHKAVHLFVSLLALFASFSFQDAKIGYAQAQAQSANLESYNDRPDVLKIKAQNHKLGIEWNDLKAAHFSFVAQLLAIYPKDVDIYFLARDSELLYDTAKLVTESTPDAKRIHLLNISRANMNDPLVVSYLAQNGISKETLAKGKKVLFVDTGFSGTIPRTISNYFPANYHAQLQTHLIVSSNAQHPSSRSFLYYLNPMIVNQNPSGMHGSIVSYEHMPRYTDRSHVFKRVDGQIHPMSSVGATSDGSVSKPESLQYMQDIKAEWQNPKVRARYQEEVNYNKVLLSMMMDGTQASTEALDQIFTDESQAAKRSRVLILDIVEANVNLKIQLKTPMPKVMDVLTENHKDQSGASKKSFLIHNQPELIPYLENPETNLPKLIQQKKWKTLGILIDADVDYEFNAVLTKLIFSRPAVGQLRALQSTLMSKKDSSTIHNLIVKAIANQGKSHVDKMSDVIFEHLAEMSKLEFPSIRNFVLDLLPLMSPEKAHTAVNYIIDNYEFSPNYGVHPDLIEFYFSNPVSSVNEDLLIKLINKKDNILNQRILLHVFANKESIAFKKSLRLISELMRNDLYWVYMYVYERLLSPEFLEELKFLTETQTTVTQENLVRLNEKYQFTYYSEKYKIIFAAAGLRTRIQRQKYFAEHWDKVDLPAIVYGKSGPPAKPIAAKPVVVVKAAVVKKVEPSVEITQDLQNGEFVLIGKKKYKVLSLAGEGRRGVVFKVSDSAGQIFALKVAKSNDAENLKSVQSESEKDAAWKKTGIDHSQVVHQGENFALKTWVEGISGEDVMKSYNSGDKKYEKAVLAIQSLMAKLAKSGVYIGDFRPPNLIWTGKKWVLVDSGSVKVGLSQAEALQKWQATDVKGDKVSRRWGSDVANALQCIKVIAK